MLRHPEKKNDKKEKRGFLKIIVLLYFDFLALLLYIKLPFNITFFDL